MITFSDFVPFLPALTLGTLAVGYATYRLNQVTARRGRLISAWDVFSRSVHYSAIELLLRTDGSALQFDYETRQLAVVTLNALEVIARQAGASRHDWEMVLSPEDHGRLTTLLTHCKGLIELAGIGQFPPDGTARPPARGKAFATLRRVFRVAR